MKWICFLLSFIWGTNLWAQNFKKDFWQVYKHHQDRDYYTQSVRVKAYANKGDTKPIYEEEGKIVKSINGYYSKLSDQETIVDGKHFLFVNHQAKQITYYDELNIDIKKFGQLYQAGLDSIDQETVKYLGAKGGCKVYQINSPDEMIKTTIVHLNMSVNTIEKIIYHYQTVGDNISALYSSIIDYKLLSTKEPSNDWFNWKKYVSVKAEKAILNKDYSSFRLTQYEAKEMDWKDLLK